MRRRGVAEVARSADKARTSVYRLLDGTAWFDGLTVARLELATGARLWPDPPAGSPRRQRGTGA